MKTELLKITFGAEEASLMTLIRLGFMRVDSPQILIDPLPLHSSRRTNINITLYNC